jgi:threonylcarbamoyladenosine tRNA methylthiotransferase MtaB
MRTFSILTLGCKVNQYESAQIRQFLEGLGLFWVKPKEKPDLFVINTCCVTATAAAKSRQYIQRAGRLNKQSKRVICGCLATLQKNELNFEKHNNVFLVASHDILAPKLRQIIGGARSPVRDALRRGCSLTISSSISNIAQYPPISPDYNNKISVFTGLTSLPKLPLLTSFKGQTRAFLKVQDGCDGVCSYCIIPKIRAEVRSKPIEDVIIEAKALVAAGHKEIVVTGVNLGSYGRSSVRRNSEIADCRLLIADLLKELAEIEGLLRIRVSSLEPGDITEELLDVFCAHKNIMPHIHLSVQSGSDKILRRMCRQYSAKELREKIAMIKSRLDRPALTCDIIVGFPGETEADFVQTTELAKWAGFSKMHIFPFSAREGTAAAKMKNEVPPKVVKERAEILRGVGDELGFQFREQFIGETCEVLLENDEPPSGRCERYFVVKVKSNPSLQHAGTGNEKVKSKNDLVKVKIMAVREDGVEGEITNDKFETNEKKGKRI